MLAVVRGVLATALVAVAVAAAVTGWRWPLEAGSILFAPMLFGVAFFALYAAVAVAPRRR